VAASGVGDAAAGRQVFRKCQACHSLEPGKNSLGPSLANVVGRKSGETADFNYSPAMKGANVVWNAATLDMPFPGNGDRLPRSAAGPRWRLPGGLPPQLIYRCASCGHEMWLTSAASVHQRPPVQQPEVQQAQQQQQPQPDKDDSSS